MLQCIVTHVPRLLSLASGTAPVDVRVAIVGNVDSGKSTLIGVLTGGGLDNGRGLARARVS
jgi:GTPase